MRRVNSLTFPGRTVFLKPFDACAPDKYLAPMETDLICRIRKFVPAGGFDSGQTFQALVACLSPDLQGTLSSRDLI